MRLLLLLLLLLLLSLLKKNPRLDSRLVRENHVSHHPLLSNRPQLPLPPKNHQVVPQRHQQENGHQAPLRKGGQTLPHPKNKKKQPPPKINNHPIIVPSDKGYCSDFHYILLKQLQYRSLSPTMISRGKTQGLECKHCTQYCSYFGSVDELKTMISWFHLHILQCEDCPNHLKVSLGVLHKNFEKGQDAGIMKPKKVRKFLKRLWKRMSLMRASIHKNDKDVFEQSTDDEGGDAADGRESVAASPAVGNHKKAKSAAAAAHIRKNDNQSTSSSSVTNTKEKRHGKKSSTHCTSTSATTTTKSSSKQSKKAPFILSSSSRSNKKEWVCRKCQTIPTIFRAKGSIITSTNQPDESSIKSHLALCKQQHPILTDVVEAIRGMTTSSAFKFDTLLHPKFQDVVKVLVGGNTELMTYFTNDVRAEWFGEEKKEAETKNGGGVWSGFPYQVDNDMAVQAMADFARAGAGCHFDFVENSNFVKYVKLIAPEYTLPTECDLIEWW
mmetsp:Transcript_31075/g.45953  ORF Transcript_31075/g.45953 Transcript_31075/m.45953 type:complete len:497 (-) Transcript_31075:58-1548(-)